MAGNLSIVSVKQSGRDSHGFTLMEAIISMAIAGIIMGGIVSGFMQAHRTSEWSAYSLAAQSLALQPLEQARGAKWDPYAYPPVDQLVAANFPDRTNVLDVPSTGTNAVYATNRVTIRTVSAAPPLKQISVECTWTFHNRGVFTNTVTTYRAADQ